MVTSVQELWQAVNVNMEHCVIKFLHLVKKLASFSGSPPTRCWKVTFRRGRVGGERRAWEWGYEETGRPRKEAPSGGKALVTGKDWN